MYIGITENEEIGKEITPIKIKITALSLTNALLEDVIYMCDNHRSFRTKP